MCWFHEKHKKLWWKSPRHRAGLCNSLVFQDRSRERRRKSSGEDSPPEDVPLDYSCCFFYPVVNTGTVCWKTQCQKLIICACACVRVFLAPYHMNKQEVCRAWWRVHCCYRRAGASLYDAMQRSFIETHVETFLLSYIGMHKTLPHLSFLHFYFSSPHLLLLEAEFCFHQKCTGDSTSFQLFSSISVLNVEMGTGTLFYVLKITACPNTKALWPN